MDFNELAQKVHQSRGTTMPVGKAVLCFDPGHTTGWAMFLPVDGVYGLHCSGEIDTDDMEKAPDAIGDLIDTFSPHIVVIEDYRVYKWRAKHHAGSTLLTARVIGCIETLAYIEPVEHIYKQPAHIAKGFCDDAKLREWGFYVEGEKHARDAIRHGCYFLLFGAIKRKDRQQVGPTVG